MIRVFSRNRKHWLSKSIKNIFGFWPENIFLYELAFLHKSLHVVRDGRELSNERLEFLGDAVIDLVVADFLFRKFPFKDEGFLTEVRSRLVSRNQLNRISERTGMDKLVQINRDNYANSRTYKGNAFEAFIGAVFIDKGFDFAQKLLIDKVFDRYVNLEEVVNNDTNFKSRLIEWAQKEKKNLVFNVAGTVYVQKKKQYRVELMLDNIIISEGFDFSVKGAEQAAAEKALQSINITQSNLYTE